MKLTKKERMDIFEKYSISKKNEDTGSPESQIALTTFRIKHLTEHLKTHKKDHGTRYSLIKMVGKRKKLLKYLKNNKIERYRAILAALSLRK